MVKHLEPVIEVNEENCINCHMCISVCPVKFCIDGSGEVVRINHDLCLGCGNCIAACTHNARQYRDDFDLFMDNLRKGEKILFIVAPAVHSNFPGKAFPDHRPALSRHRYLLRNLSARTATLSGSRRQPHGPYNQNDKGIP